MAEIEDKRSSREAFQYAIDSMIERFAANQERHWIEIALNRFLRLKLIARKPKETNVIDISTAEVMPAEPEPENRLNIQRIRPVAIPPPQVRIL